MNAPEEGPLYADVSDPGWIDVTSHDAAYFIADLMGSPPPPIPTLVPAIDRSMWTWGQRKGIPRGTYALVGGASNIGKTQFGLHLARAAAMAGERTGFVSLDMKLRDALLRIHMAIVDEVPPTHWQPDRWKPEYETLLKDGLRRWRLSIEGDLGIYAVPHGTLEWTKHSIEKGIDAGATYFVVDHLQKIRVSGFGDNQIASRAEVISETLDNLCDEHNVTIVGLSQLNREASRLGDRSPTMHDLWGGTAMEANAAVVIMLDHSRYARDVKAHHIGRTWVILAKNNMGPKGFEIPVEWDHRTFALREALDDEVHLWPDKPGSKRR